MVLHSQRFATETLIRLSEKIPNVEIILEYSVKPYRIDAYLAPSRAIVVHQKQTFGVYLLKKQIMVTL